MDGNTMDTEKTTVVDGRTLRPERQAAPPRPVPHAARFDRNGRPIPRGSGTTGGPERGDAVTPSDSPVLG